MEFLHALRDLGQSAETDARVLTQIAGRPIVARPARDKLLGAVDAYHTGLERFSGEWIAQDLTWRYGYSAEGAYIAGIQIALNDQPTCIGVDDMVQVFGTSFEKGRQGPVHGPGPKPGGNPLAAAIYTLPSGARLIFSYSYQPCAGRIVVRVRLP